MRSILIAIAILGMPACGESDLVLSPAEKAQIENQRKEELFLGKRDCMSSGQVHVCTEYEKGPSTYSRIKEFRVMATRESFDPKFLFSEPIYSGWNPNPPDLKIPPNANLQVSDGWVWWVWKEAK